MVIIANNFDNDALKILKLKKNLRLIDASNLSQNEILKFNSINNSMMVQTEDNKIFSKKSVPNKVKEGLFCFRMIHARGFGRWML